MQLGPLNDKARRTALHRALSDANKALDTTTKSAPSLEGPGPDDSYVVVFWKARKGKKRKRAEGACSTVVSVVAAVAEYAG